MDPQPEHPGSTSSRLRARPGEAVSDCVLPAGCTPLGLAEARDGLLHVPVAATTRPSPLVVLLHGAGSSASAALMLLADLTEAHGLVLLVPDSRASSWDFLRGGYGPDVHFIDRARARVRALPDQPGADRARGILRRRLLRAGGLDVAHEEFDGGHSVPRELAWRAVGWMVEA